MKSLLQHIADKKQLLDSHLPIAKDHLTNLLEWYKVELTYTSNAIEGNTLSRAETALVVEKGLTVKGKTLTEHLEAVNHAEAFDYILNLANSKALETTESVILDLHRLILQKIDDANAGRYRSVPVRIAGSTVIMPNALKVPDLMREFITWIKNSKNDPLTLAKDAHFKLVSIHPFVDGNGRTARLLMNLLLLHSGYPPAIINKEDRKSYISSIEKAQLGGSMSDYNQIIYQAVDSSLDTYLASIENQEKVKTISTKSTLKIGELAKLAGVPVPTIRHWTKEGLLDVVGYTPSGYQLYTQDALKQTKKILKLQKDKRLTLSEIKSHF